MTIVQWDSKLELGIGTIDEQHKQLLGYANSFFVEYQHGSAVLEAQCSIAFLQQYVLYHFQAEEAFQVACGYPRYREHQAKHSWLTMQVEVQRVQLEDAKFDQQSMEAFYQFFVEWISSHVLEDDMDFALHYKATKK